MTESAQPEKKRSIGGLAKTFGKFAAKTAAFGAAAFAIKSAAVAGLTAAGAASVLSPLVMTGATLAVGALSVGLVFTSARVLWDYNQQKDALSPDTTRWDFYKGQKAHYNKMFLKTTGLSLIGAGIFEGLSEFGAFDWLKGTLFGADAPPVVDAPDAPDSGNAGGTQEPPATEDTTQTAPADDVQTTGTAEDYPETEIVAETQAPVTVADTTVADGPQTTAEANVQELERILAEQQANTTAPAEAGPSDLEQHIIEEAEKVLDQPIENVDTTIEETTTADDLNREELERITAESDTTAHENIHAQSSADSPPFESTGMIQDADITDGAPLIDSDTPMIERPDGQAIQTPEAIEFETSVGQSGALSQQFEIVGSCNVTSEFSADCSLSQSTISGGEGMSFTMPDTENGGTLEVIYGLEAGEASQSADQFQIDKLPRAMRVLQSI